MNDLCRCPDHCGLPVNGERWYAWKCPWYALRLEDRKRKANERYRRKKGHAAKIGRPKKRQDIPDAEIDRIFEMAIPWLRWRARQTGQAA